MASTLGLSVASGVAFGAALTSASVYQPRVIVDQMRLTDFHMLLAFLAASAASAVAIATANRTGWARLGHRTDSTYGWFGRHDANLVGGALLGAGMALTGACPGTVLVQLGVGQAPRHAVWLTAAGQLLGGLAFVRLGPSLKLVDDSSSNNNNDKSYTVMQKTGLSTSATVLAYEGLCALLILAATHLPRSPHWLHPLTGGLLIGLAQVASIALTRKSLGVSGAYADLGKLFWAGPSALASVSSSSIPFATGIIAGGYLAKHLALVPASEFAPRATADTSAIAALVGGFIMIFGARLAGGCTSGHGISGMSTLSISSFITVAAMFAGGILTAAVLY